MAGESFYQYLMSEDSTAKRPRTKRVLTLEDVHYMQKIEELANERLNFFRDQELREVKETKNLTVVSNFKRQKIQRKLPKKEVRTSPVINKTTERLNEFIVNKMNGTDMKLVIQKNLYKSDTKKGLNRLNMPMNQLATNEFLTVDEKRVINGKNPKENAIEVGLVGPTLEMYKKPMKLKIWRMASTVNYVLMTNWYDFWSANKKCLMEDSKIQVWSFRREGRLCFAVVCVDEPEMMVNGEDDVV